MPEPSYTLARAARGPKITMGKGMHRVDPQNASRTVIETPGVNDKTHEATPEEIRREAIKNRGGLYSDRIKIEPKFGFKEPPPKKSDTEIQQHAATAETKI